MADDTGAPFASADTSNGEASRYDVLIVGCGPAGAALANFLRRYGCRVAIFDRDRDVFFAPRATGLDDQSLRIYQALGFFDRLVAEGHIRQGALWFKDQAGRTLMTLDRMSIGEDLLTGDTGHFAMNFFDQPSVERILREDFDRPGGADAYLGHEVLAVDDRGDQTQLVAKDRETGRLHKFIADYIVGCDGGQSLVRRSMNVERLDLGYSEDYLVVDAVVDDETYWRTRIPDGGVVTMDPRHSGVLAKGVHGFVRFDRLRHPDVVGDGLETKPKLEEAGRALIVACGLDPDKFRPVRYAPYTFYAGMPATWRKGRLLLAGDAAHQTPPWAGQGFNMCMRDAANLSFKLGLVLAGHASDTILDTYVEERQPDSIRRIKGAVKTGKMMQTTSRWRILARSFSFFLHRNSRVIRRAMFRSMQRRVPYKAGLIGKTRLAGTIMPQPNVSDLKGHEKRLDDLIGDGFALITSSSPTGPSVERFVKTLRSKVLQLGPDFGDPAGHMSTWFRRNRINAVLIRPDRYIYDAGNSADEICQALFADLNAPDFPTTAKPKCTEGLQTMPDQIAQIEKYTNALNAGDIDTALSVMADNFSLTDPFFVDGLSPKTAVAEYYRASFSATDISLQFKPTNIVQHGNTVFVELDTIAGDTSVKGCNVFEFDGDKLVALRAYANGLSELVAG